MSSILLGPLAYTDFNKNGLNSIYQSDMENKIKQIQQNQARQNFSKPEYLNQFDDLRIDNIGTPVGVNESFSTQNGVNSSLQRNLDFKNGYSQFQNTDMHYDIVSRENFTHNNMVPNTRRRDFSKNADRIDRKLETFTGVMKDYTPKKEKVPLFQPMTDLTFVNGMPAVASKIQNRFLPSNKNNFGNLPFQNKVRVRPGIGDKQQQGNYAVYRVNPRNVDQMRSDINQKIIYENKPLETIKKGEIRGPDFNLTKYKMPDFRETKFYDLVPSKATVDGPKHVGVYTNVTSQRNETDRFLPGPGVNTNLGGGPDAKKVKFQETKRVTFGNDPLHAISAVNQKPVMTNIKSYTNYETQRASVNAEYQAPLGGSQSNGYTVDYKNAPLTTLRQLMINGETNIGVSSTAERNGYVFSNDFVLPVTKRQFTTSDKILGPNAEVKLVKTYNEDQAKPTIRNVTSHNLVINAVSMEKQPRLYNEDEARLTLRPDMNHNIVTNAVSMEKQPRLYNEDEARMTLRPDTNHNIVTNAGSMEKQPRLYNEDEARMTLRPDTNHNIVTNAVSMEKQTRVYNEDEARMTLRPDTNHNIVTNAVSMEKQARVYNEDQAKPTIKHNTLFTNPEINIKNNVPATYTELTDKAKPTIKESSTINARPNGNPAKPNAVYTRDETDEARTTLRQQTEDTKQIGAIKSTNIEGTYVRDLLDQAKGTQRQTTEITQFIGHVKSANKESSYVIDINDKAKPTIKETTIFTTPAGRTLKQTGSIMYTRDVTDEARPTIKQTTVYQNYVGGLKSEIEAKISHESAKNMEIDDRRQIGTYNRPANAKGDLHGPYIDPENVRFNDRRVLFNYVSHPHKKLDFSVMPTTSNEVIQTVYSMSKPVIESSTYYINPNFINTLKNNPLVNDIYHPKNV